LNTPLTLRELSCADDYDPNSMPVDKAREYIRTFLTPVTATSASTCARALGRVLAEDIRRRSRCPATTIRRWTASVALRRPECRRAGHAEGHRTSFAGKPFGRVGQHRRSGPIMTGGVLPEGADYGGDAGDG
jgi:molybdopterin molybdotransferase